MLKKILLSHWTALLTLAFFVCLPSIVKAQFRYDYPIVCDDTKTIIKVLEKEFEEKLSWKGSHVDDNSVYALWINEKNQNWTLLKMTPITACILGTGTNSDSTFGTPI